MKKSVKLLSMALVVVMLCLAFTACGKTLSGEYEAEINLGIVSYTATYEFNGNKVTITKDVDAIINDPEPVEFTGTYEITEEKDGDLKIKLTLDGDAQDEHIKAGTYSLEIEEDYIKIAGVKYDKVEK